MLKILHFIVWLAVWVGIGDAFINLIIVLSVSAIHAHRHDQISYEKFSRMLTSTSASKSTKVHK